VSTTVLAFFNNKGGVGKTSLVFHLAWMFHELGLSVLAADLDPQANLTSAFVNEDEFEDLFGGPVQGDEALTLYGAVQPLIEGTGDVKAARLRMVGERLGLICGDLLLSSFEDQLAESWPKCLSGDKRAFRVTTAFWRVIQQTAQRMRADVAVVDLGPNLGSINRASLIASDYVIIPLAPDLFSLQGLRNLGPTLRKWRLEWSKRLQEGHDVGIPLPKGDMQPVGYIVQQHAVRLDRPVQAYARWMEKIPCEYQSSVRGEPTSDGVQLSSDPNCLRTLKNFRSLMPLAQEAHKPMFFLKAADGALGSHAIAALDVYRDFKQLAEEIAKRCSVPLRALV
jgi:cellulose biosynthesis protein BcsQ